MLMLFVRSLGNATTAFMPADARPRCIFSDKGFGKFLVSIFFYTRNDRPFGQKHRKTVRCGGSESDRHPSGSATHGVPGIVDQGER